MDNLETIRKKIDNIDKQIAALLKKRASEIGKIKKIKTTQKLPVFDRKREKEILQKLENNYEKEIFKKIIKESRKIQEDGLN